MFLLITLWPDLVNLKENEDKFTNRVLQAVEGFFEMHEEGVIELQENNCGQDDH